MNNYVLRHLMGLVPLLFLLSVLTFFTLRILPGDAAVARGGLGATEEQVAEIRHEMGLDKPYFPVSFGEPFPFIHFHDDSQYEIWITGVLRGDFGQSMVYQSPVTDEILDRLPVTLELLFLATAMTMLLGVPLGVIAALTRNSPLDYILRTVSVLGLSIPAFWLGTMMLIFPAIWFGWAPPPDYQPIWEAPAHNLKQFALPAFALSLATAATVIRITRAAVLDILSQDYIRTAWAKGLRQRQVVIGHILRNAMVPVTSFVGIQMLTLIGGAVVVERIFNLDGIGLLLFTGVFSRDYALVQALVLLIGAMVLLVNLSVDVINARLDPRIRLA